ncbi:DUF1772 domain-containing protein [Glutamicibacter sp. MNS18]|uniref:DUF1772 domain-containing protein n=1 Tax=Glutamicibacter sp. MNS18 TaxID=2989817 RepID=UPI0022360F8F|nr:DUF1772 domain-containing protein [Glutamicibacter sp. MNS18]MCW4464480.1 DUF1772 domain-containing protein [Glutamicibacter sp. MNS18]
MTTAVAWVALAVAVVNAFGASFYMGLMLVLRFVLGTAFRSLDPHTLPVFFSQPIIGATRFLKRMFTVYFLCALALLWFGWPDPAATGFAALCVLSYGYLAVWFIWKMQPVNDELISGTVTDPDELARKVDTWISLNRVRVVTTVIYWLAAMGFLVAAHDLWEILP